ncbi:MAG: NAD(P)-dependent oxidoreductase [Gammaproteobacteria bacterium PRO9]|nr:NAD(P)-dependent oxidoreductase [Gammaproteobacteria bacterium PRO9]
MMIDQAFTTTPSDRVAFLAWAAEYGGRMAPSPADAARNADLVFTCVGNDEDLRAVVLGDGGAMAGMAPGRIGMAPHTSCWSHWI